MYQKYRNGEISAIQLHILIISFLICAGVLDLSRLVGAVSQQDAWISVFINGLFISFIMIIIVYTISRFPQYNFLQYISYLLGKPLGYLVAISYCFYAALVTATIIRLLSEMIYTWLLPNTSIYILNFIIVITALYMIRNGLTVLARFNEVIVFMLIPFFVLIFVGLPEASLINLRPIGGAGIVNILKGVVPSFFAFGGSEIVLVYYPYISDKQKPIMKYSVISIMLVTAFYTALVISQMAFYGPQEIQQVLYPSISYLSASIFPVIERLELFFTIFWIFTVLATIGIQYLASCIVLQNIFVAKKTSFFAYILAPVIYLLSLYPQNTAEVVDFGDTIGKIYTFYGLALPLLLLIMYFIKEKKSIDKKNS
ncbi:spore germination protein (amino acid permease) [Anaerovirgula multivorans]|uniref:Spore germination protein (Amino acid permease) n=1 Tax=Anaerovirgula multivorans TaxID=312168 RepID=A0A239JZ93_9FIRM|nr:endospore germination permease [Anaerovirgula multivorans]SNT10164.1 spore germination protein (amino acid permease) [Anaerovirgula multivorans]